MKNIIKELNKRLAKLNESALHGKSKRVRDENRGAFHELQDFRIWLSERKEPTSENKMQESKALHIPVVMPRFFKERRLSLNLSMQDVTDKTDISKATISRVERGNDAFFGTVMTLDKFYTSNGA